MFIVDLTMGCVTKMGMVVNRIQNYPRYKSLKDLAPGFVFDEVNWFYPRCEIKSLDRSNLIAWLELVKETFPEVSEEIESVLLATGQVSSGRVVLFELLNVPEYRHLLQTWSAHDNQSGCIHPGGPHPESNVKESS